MRACGAPPPILRSSPPLKAQRSACPIHSPSQGWSSCKHPSIRRAESLRHVVAPDLDLKRRSSGLLPEHHHCEDLGAPAQQGALTEVPELPTAIDAQSTARWTEALLAGQRPLPAPLLRQVQVLQALRQARHKGA